MPIRNTAKEFKAPAYYHVYNRGVGDLPIFHDDADRVRFLSLFARHLGSDDTRDADGLPYKKYDTKLIAYCLMGNHFHLLLFQESDPNSVTKLMRSVSTAYAMYFNHRHKRHGHLFQSTFKASEITDESYLLHITRYIHMNPRNYLRYRWSSISYFLGTEPPSWLHPNRLNDTTQSQYREFLRSYEGKKAELELLKSQLADK